MHIMWGGEGDFHSVCKNLVIQNLLPILIEFNVFFVVPCIQCLLQQLTMRALPPNDTLRR